MKKIYAAILILAMALALAGCKSGGKEDPVTTRTEEMTSQETTVDVLIANDPVVYQMTDIDSNDWYEPTGIDTILLTASGRLTLLTNGELKEKAGAEVTLAMNAVSVDLLSYGNAGFRAVLFIRSDGTLSAVRPRDLMENHQITIIDYVGGLENVREVYETQDMDAFGIMARTEDGTETLIDPFLH